MSRAASLSSSSLRFLPLPGPGARPGRRPLAGAAAWLCALSLAVLAGCASKGPTTADGRPLPPTPSRADRDGAPSDAPPDLASLPDPVPQVEPIRQGGPNKPYTVLGQSYQPIAKDVRWSEKGVASWYGTKFHGRRTASGEMFSMYGLTAAHRTLPIPSYARVRHARTGKEIIVRINDRGPFHSSRVIDLSYAAAVKLGMVGAGSAPVEIERITFDEIRSGAWKRDGDGQPGETAVASTGSAVPPSIEALAQASAATPVVSPLPGGEASPASVTPVSDATSGKAAPLVKVGAARAHTPAAKGFWVQLAALGRRDGVDRLHQKVSAAMAELTPLLAIFHESSLFKLQAGPYASRREAVSAAEQAREVLQLTPMVVERR